MNGFLLISVIPSHILVFTTRYLHKLTSNFHPFKGRITNV